MKWNNSSWFLLTLDDKSLNLHYCWTFSLSASVGAAVGGTLLPGPSPGFKVSPPSSVCENKCDVFNRISRTFFRLFQYIEQLTLLVPRDDTLRHRRHCYLAISFAYTQKPIVSRKFRQIHVALVTNGDHKAERAIMKNGRKENETDRGQGRKGSQQTLGKKLNSRTIYWFASREKRLANYIYIEESWAHTKHIRT